MFIIQYSMMEMIFLKLSVIVPVYNLELYISRAIESLLNINFDNDYEIIIINDGSTDKSKEIIANYMIKSNIIHLINIENKGVSNARNIGIKEANGEYITFVDGDDTVNRDFFRIAVNELEKGKYDFVQVNYKSIKKGKVCIFKSVSKDTVINDKSALFDCLLGDNKIKIFNAVWGKVYRTEFLKNKHFDVSLRIAEDQKFIFDLLCEASQIKLLKYIGYNYYIRSDSAMNSFDVKKQMDTIKVLEYCLKFLPYNSTKQNIEFTRLEWLLIIYENATIKGIECSNIYMHIRNIRYDELKSKTGYDKRKKILRFKHRIIKYRKIYNFILKNKNFIKKMLGMKHF